MRSNIQPQEIRPLLNILEICFLCIMQISTINGVSTMEPGRCSVTCTPRPMFHYQMGQKLASLKDDGILIVGSGNIVHNLRAYNWSQTSAEPYDWAARFEQQAQELLLAGDHDPLINYMRLGRDAMLSIPTPDHYLPLLYVIGSQKSSERVSFPVKGIDGGSISMLAVQVG